ncbi:MAG: sulfatase [Acidobacteria bacterium]|nr:sulfatase [Acidobacteriota bacterium]
MPIKKVAQQAVWLVLLTLFCTTLSNATQSNRPPNIIFIYADDMGYGDLSAFGAQAIKTPNLDRMAAEGLKLTSFYSVSPVCTPSRAALLTGRYAARMGIENMHLSNVLTFQDKTGLPTNETTIATALKARGYATGCIGKWHLGHLAPHRPLDHGFDYYFGIPYSNDMQPSMLKKMDETIEQPVKQETLTLRYTQEAARFIEQNKARPFFLYLPHNMPHIPLFASDKFKGKSVGGIYGDVVEELDWSVGEVLATLKRLSLDRNTLVFFASDNGPWYQGSPGQLRGRKGWTYDGGVRVPGIVRWPGKIKGGTVSDEPLATIDIFPTLMTLVGEANGSKLPLDGMSAVNFLFGKEKTSPGNLYLFFDKEFLQTARFGKWKIHVARWNVQRYQAGANNQINQTLSTPELYDMSIDLGESYNQAARYPEVVRELRQRIAARLKTFPAEIQQANSDLMK